jgi:hypothetical protein
MSVRKMYLAVFGRLLDIGGLSVREWTKIKIIKSYFPFRNNGLRAAHGFWAKKSATGREGVALITTKGGWRSPLKNDAWVVDQNMVSF